MIMAYSEPQKTDQAPLVSICIPSYNRPDELIQLLESIATQKPGPWDIVICEDRSPRGTEIEAAVHAFSEVHPELRLNYFTNDRNLGYDGNLRLLIEKAEGQYCLFMGDDDLLAPDSLGKIIMAVSRPGIGLVLRAWKSIDKETGTAIEEHRYFPEDRIFPAGLESIVACYRRSVFISGLTVHRETARKYHTERFDGMLLYQLYLVGRILSCLNGYYVSDIVAIRKIGGMHFFGSSDSEKGRFAPSQLLPSHSISFVKGLYDIASVLDAEFVPGVRDLINDDLSRYSYPLLEIQAQRLSKNEFRKYAHELAGLGLGKTTLFWFYYFALLLMGPDISNSLVRSAKRMLGRTPSMGGSSGLATSSK